MRLSVDHIIFPKRAVSVLNFHQELCFVWVHSGTVLDEEQNALKLHIASMFPFVKAFSLISLWAISLLSGNNHKVSKSLIKIDVKDI